MSGGALDIKLEESGEIKRKTPKSERTDLEVFLNEDRTQQIVPPVLSLVKQLHDNGVTHGDMHTGNILVSYDGRLLITDFDYTRRFSLKRSMCWKFE